MKIANVCAFDIGSRAVAVIVRDNAGAEGVAIADASTLAHLESVAPSALGETPAAAPAFSDYADKAFPDRAARRAAAALDIAMWDLAAKKRGEPLWRTLGGGDAPANAHVSGSAESEDFDALMSAVKTSGFREVKLAASGDPEEIITAFKKLNGTMSRPGRDPVFMLDAGERWPPKIAAQTVQQIEREIDLTCVEAPTAMWDASGTRRISNDVRAAIANSADHCRFADLLAHFRAHSLNVIQIDISLVGISGALRVADAAYGYELPVTLAHYPGGVAAHLAGALPYFMSMELPYGAITDDRFQATTRLKDGKVQPGDGAGHGVTFEGCNLRPEKRVFSVQAGNVAGVVR